MAEANSTKYILSTVQMYLYEALEQTKLMQDGKHHNSVCVRMGK